MILDSDQWSQGVKGWAYRVSGFQGIAVSVVSVVPVVPVIPVVPVVPVVPVFS